MIKEKDTEPGKNPCASLQSLPPMKSQRIHSSPSKENAATDAQCRCPGKPVRDSEPKFLSGLIMQFFPTLHVPKFQTPKKGSRCST